MIIERTKTRTLVRESLSQAYGSLTMTKQPNHRTKVGKRHFQEEGKKPRSKIQRERNYGVGLKSS